MFWSTLYTHSAGLPEARQALADHYKCKFENVVITSGCSQAVVFGILASAAPGDNILIPKPGFPLYQCIADAYQIEVREYQIDLNVKPRVNLQHAESLIDEKTKAIIINNPSNPLGSNFSASHVQEIANFAERNDLIVIADEIYHQVVFQGKHHSFAQTQAKCFVLGGLAKAYCVPGWRVGWILGYRLPQDIQESVLKLSQLIIGANTLAQSIIKVALETPVDISLYKRNAIVAAQILNLPAPEAAMYLWIPAKNDVVIFKRALQEENLMVLPGSCFSAPGYIRLALCQPTPLIKEACHRLKTIL